VKLKNKLTCVDAFKQNIHEKNPSFFHGGGSPSHFCVSLFISILCTRLGKRKIRHDNATIQEAVMWHMIGPLNARKSHLYCFSVSLCHLNNSWK